MAYDAYGSDDVLTLRELPDPKVGPGEVRIRVRRAGVNPVDWKVMSGGLDGLMDAVFPVVPGWDVAGTVESVGIDTPEFEVGRRGRGVRAQGRRPRGHVRRARDDERPRCGPQVRCAELGRGGRPPLAGLTALQTLDRLSSQPRTRSVHGGAGGVGALAVQIAKARGARVIATASPANHEFLSGLGATPVAYGEGVVERIREVAPTASTSSPTSWAASATSPWPCWPPAGGTRPSPTRRAGDRRLVVLGAPSAEGLAELGRLADAGQLRVPVAHVLPLEELPAAFAQSREGHVRGKLVIAVSDCAADVPALGSARRCAATSRAASTSAWSGVPSLITGTTTSR